MNCVDDDGAPVRVDSEEEITLWQAFKAFMLISIGDVIGGIGGEDEKIFRSYYFRILIRHTRLTFGLVALMCVITSFLYLDASQTSKGDEGHTAAMLFAANIVFAMVSILSLGLSFLSFYRLVWKVYIMTYAVVSLVISFSSANTVPLAVELSMINIIVICLVSGLPFIFSLSLCIFNVAIFQFAALCNGASTIAMLRYNGFFIIYIGFMMYASQARERGIRSQFETLETVKVQRHKSDSIIQHMLPPFVVQKLKLKHDSVIVDHFDSVTVMFCEIVNFNALLEMMPAQEVVQLLNDVYTAFDRLTDVHGVNKVEHIGNVYVVSAGCPEVTPYHSGRVAEMGLKMLSVVRHFKKVEIRLGIHTGAVMAGVIGFKKLSYHLFGDTINTASRMCSHGAPQRIHVSESTYCLLNTKYTFESRGEITVKGKGKMHTYFLEGRKAQLHGEKNAILRATQHVLNSLPLPPANPIFPTISPYSTAIAGGANTEMKDFIQSHMPAGNRTHRASTIGGPSGPHVTTTTTGSRIPDMRVKRKVRLCGCTKQRFFEITGTPNLTPVQFADDDDDDYKSRYKRNIFTQMFRGDAEIEDEFRRRNADVHHTRMCCSMVFTLIGFAFCGMYDYYYGEGSKAQYYIFRYLFCLFGIAGVALACKLRDWVEAITLSVLASTYVATLIIEVWGHRHHPLGLTTIVLSMYISSMTFNVSCVRFVHAAVLHLVGFTLFELMQLVQVTPNYELGIGSGFVIFGTLMNAVACYMQEMHERDSWVHELVLDDEIDKTDALLTGLLPVSILVELKLGRQLIADKFDQVSIMLTDIVGFTEIAGRISPAQLVDFLNVLFSVFDRLADKYGVLKIATIGDAYLCIAGCPEKCGDHAEKIANMALEMIESVQAIIAPDGTQVRVRIGMHTGPVIAGVVGIKMIHYQIWGDSVQIAQKMESSGKASHIHVSHCAHELLEKTFQFEQADNVRIKDIDMPTWFLTGRTKPQVPLSPFVAVKRGLLSQGPGTPRRVDLSSSMIFQNAGSWSHKKPSSPPPAQSNLTSSQRVLSARRFNRTPRRSDILTPLPTHRMRKASMLVVPNTGASRNEVDIDTPDSVTSNLIDNLLGLNPSFDPSDLHDTDDYTDEYIVSVDDPLGSPPSTEPLMYSGDGAGRDRRDDDEDEIIASLPNFTFGNALRLTSIVPQRLPPAPSVPHISTPPSTAPQIPPPSLVRELRSPGSAQPSLATSQTFESLVLHVPPTPHPASTRPALQKELSLHLALDSIKKDTSVT